jgi:hypothetical protein
MRARLLVLAAAAAVASSCSSQSEPNLGPSTFVVGIQSVNGKALPAANAPLPPNDGINPDKWAFTIDAMSPTGVPESFNGYVRLTVEPGTVLSVTGSGVQDRNILVVNGHASGVADLLSVYGPSRLWVEDLGYLPAAPGKVPACSNGIDDNHNGLTDFPSDPGCYYADDDSEDGGTYAAGVSPIVLYSLPTIADVRGADGARTPYPNEGVSILASSPEKLIVTRVSSGGFFVTDVNATQMKNGKNSLFAFNFSTPPGMAVCDQIYALSGTANDFYGYTQLGFPSWGNTHVDVDAGPGCEVPDPIVLAPNLFNTMPGKTVVAKLLYPYESSLVRITGVQIAKYIGSTPVKNGNPAPGSSNCDFNGDGQIDYTEIAPACPADSCEGTCAINCDADPDCSEWSDFSARNEIKVSVPGTLSMIKINVGTVSTFDPVANAGKMIDVVTGTLTEFSGGDLNWTIEARCEDDLVCPAELGCTTQSIIPPQTACVRPPTADDNDEGTN